MRIRSSRFALPVPITYNVLLTLISALVAILVAGVGLFIASFGVLTPRKPAAAGLLMGLGFSTMHYVGLAAGRVNVVVDYPGVLAALSILIGICASALALWLAPMARCGLNSLSSVRQDSIHRRASSRSRDPLSLSLSSSDLWLTDPVKAFWVASPVTPIATVQRPPPLRARQDVRVRTSC